MAINAATLGKFWARLAFLKGMNQRQAAEAAGRRPESFSNWKSGKGMELESFNAMNDALGVDADIALLIGQHDIQDDDLILELSILVRAGKDREVRRALRQAGYDV